MSQDKHCYICDFNPCRCGELRPLPDGSTSPLKPWILRTLIERNTYWKYDGRSKYLVRTPSGSITDEFISCVPIEIDPKLTWKAADALYMLLSQKTKDEEHSFPRPYQYSVVGHNQGVATLSHQFANRCHSKSICHPLHNRWIQEGSLIVFIEQILEDLNYISKMYGKILEDTVRTRALPYVLCLINFTGKKSLQINDTTFEIISLAEVFPMVWWSLEDAKKDYPSIEGALSPFKDWDLLHGRDF